MAAVIDIKIKRGASLYAEFEYFQSDGTTPLDISTWDVWGAVKASPNGGIIAPLTIGIKSGTTHVLTLSLTDTQTENIPTTGANFSQLETYYYDVKYDAGSEVDYLQQGAFQVEPRVTV